MTQESSERHAVSPELIAWQGHKDACSRCRHARNMAMMCSKGLDLLAKYTHIPTGVEARYDIEPSAMTTTEPPDAAVHQSVDVLAEAKELAKGFAGVRRRASDFAAARAGVKSEPTESLSARIARRTITWIDRATPHTIDNALTRDPLVFAELVAIVESELSSTHAQIERRADDLVHDFYNVRGGTVDDAEKALLKSYVARLVVECGGGVDGFNRGLEEAARMAEAREIEVRNQMDMDLDARLYRCDEARRFWLVLRARISQGGSEK